MLFSVKSLTLNWWFVCSRAGVHEVGSLTQSLNCCCKLRGTRVLRRFGLSFPSLWGELAGELEMPRFFGTRLWEHVGASVDTSCEWKALSCTFSKWTNNWLVSVSAALNFVLWARLNQLNGGAIVTTCRPTRIFLTECFIIFGCEIFRALETLLPVGIDSLILGYLTVVLSMAYFRWAASNLLRSRLRWDSACTGLFNPKGQCVIPTWL